MYVFRILDAIGKFKDFEYHKSGVPTPHGVILSVELRPRDTIEKQGIVGKHIGLLHG